MTSQLADMGLLRTVLAEVATINYRSLILENAGGAPDWRYPDWIDQGACRDQPAQPAQPRDCDHCPVQAACLTAALVLDDPSRIRAGLTRVERRQLFADLEEIATQLETWLAGLASAGPATADCDGGSGRPALR